MVWMNERRQVKIGQLIKNGSKARIDDVSSDEMKIENNFKLVHTKGQLSTAEELEDDQFGIKLE